MKKLITLSAVSLIILSINAQAPQKMSYQAVIRNSSGQLVSNHSVGMRISILQGSATGTAVYVETQTPTTNANGLATIEIGGGTVVSGIFSTINWTGGTFYLKTETDPAGGTGYTITGTNQILSVPYALYAKNAGSYTENDPVFFSSPAKGISSGNISNWNAAYGWGNHAGLYRPIGYVPAWSEITGKPTTTTGYGITDAVTIATTQTITGNKTFSNDLLINWITVGSGKSGDHTNTAIGFNTLFYNTTGACNTANGFASLYSNTEGNYNTANGNHALYLNTTGSYNTANGYGALELNTTGDHITAVGSDALGSNTTGAANTALGSYALKSNTTANYNTAAGNSSLMSNTIGSDNTAVGVNALLSNTTGSMNVAVGRNALLYSQGNNKNTAVGYGALLNTTRWDNTAVGCEALVANTTGFDNSAFGMNSLTVNTSGCGNTGIGKNSMMSHITGNNNTAVGFNSDVSEGITNATAIGYGAVVTSSNKIVLGNASATTVGGYGTWTNYSDRRLKENIIYDNKLGLNFITKLKPVFFNYIDDTKKNRRQGLIAQDVEQILDELGLEFSGLIIDDDQEKTMNLSYSSFVIPLITAVQEQQKQIEELKQLVQSLMQK